MDTQDVGGDARAPELKLDSRNVQGFVAFFKSLPQDESTLRLFDRKGYYTVHGSDADRIAVSFFGSKSSIRHLSLNPSSSSSPSLSSLSINASMFESILRALLLSPDPSSLPPPAACYSAVEVYESTGGPSSSSSWQVGRRATPSRLSAFEDVLFGSQEMQDSPLAASLVVAPAGTEAREGGRQVGLAFVDLCSLRIGFTTFLDDPQFTHLESALIALGCRECVVPATAATAGGGGGGGGTGGRRAGTGEDAEGEEDAQAEGENGGTADAGEGAVGKKGRMSPEARRLRDVLARCNVVVHEARRSSFKGSDAEMQLSRLLKRQEAAAGSSSSSKRDASGNGSAISSAARVKIDSAVAASAVGGLLEYADVKGKEELRGQFTLVPYSLSLHMRLDAAALRALHVVDSRAEGMPGGGAGSGSGSGVSPYNPLSKTFSLLGLMDKTCSAGLGRRLLVRWLKQPLVDVGDIRGRQDVVEALLGNQMLRHKLRASLRGVPDVERLARKLDTGKAGLQDIVRLYKAKLRVEEMCAAFSSNEGDSRDLLMERYGDALIDWCSDDHLGRFGSLVEAAVDSEAMKKGEYLISPAYSEELQEIKEERDGVVRQADKELGAAAGDLGLVAGKSIKLDETSKAGFCFRITKSEEKGVRKQLNASYVTLETRKDGVKFTSARLRRLSERHLALTEDYVAKQRALVLKVVAVAQTFVEVFESVASLVAEVDVLQGFAELAAVAPPPYTRPHLTPSDSGDIVLEDCRHPCVELHLSSHVAGGDNGGSNNNSISISSDAAGSFMANDCRLERGKSWCQIITGPNMGGKSTYIRQVGVVVLMAQVGSYVPCSHASISVRDAIFARVGAGDCQLRGVSTFMAEMLETAAILGAATPRSLIIIDELGRGTSTYDGFGLAWAICEHLIDHIRAPTLFATHFHELTGLAHRASPPGVVEPVGVANFHVSAHVDAETRKVSMLYKVLPGACDQSYGIHVAEFAGFPPEVVAMARDMALQLESFDLTAGLTALPASGKESDKQAGKRKDLSGEDHGEGHEMKKPRGHGGNGDKWNPSESEVRNMQRFLEEFSALPVETMDRKELWDVIVQKAEEPGNEWLKGELLV